MTCITRFRRHIDVLSDLRFLCRVGDHSFFIIDAYSGDPFFVSNGLHDLIHIFTPVEQHTIAHRTLDNVAHIGSKPCGVVEKFFGLPIDGDGYEYSRTNGHNHGNTKEQPESQIMENFHSYEYQNPTFY